MPAGWLIFSFVLFFGVMLAFKFGLKVAIETYGLWIVLPLFIVGFGIAKLVDRSDAKKKRDRAND